ncbi:cation:proton antiporter regulatory subunit [Haloarcula pelagica]|uniref:cation:proton antiporter regulatory subunit n=1 Tax=Haloarcula pelagica TaxID=3033389 RepID=UPI0024C31996|nr:TrkA C-terminal domain-containing protein [Halomicroarcula sp. YJ-61-S]
MEITESDLPGVGKKHEIEIGGGQRLVIVTHNTGKRQLFLKEGPDADSEELFELSDKLARTVGTVLEGAYFQPVASEKVETMLTEGTLLEWYGIEADSPLVGETLRSADVGQRTGVTVVAVQREDEVLSDTLAETEIRAGDTLVVVGDRDSCDQFEALLAGDA